MKKCYFSFFVVVGFLFFTGCDKNGNNKNEEEVIIEISPSFSSIISDSFVLGYYDVNKIILDNRFDNQANGVTLNHLRIITPMFDTVMAISSDKDKLSEYKKLCEKNGDTSFKQRRELHNASTGYSFEYSFVSSCDFTLINVTCDKDWDSEHPKGTSLNDITLLKTVSFREFIAGGYQGYEMDKYSNIDSKDYDKGFGPDDLYRTELIKPISEYSATDLSFFGAVEQQATHAYGSLGWMIFSSIPTTSDEEYTITITMTTTTDQSFSSSCTVTANWLKNFNKLN